MRVLRCASKLLFLLAGLMACKDIPRDNPLDPKNPESVREQTVLAEAFVNTNSVLADSVLYNQNMLTALYRLQSKYGSRMVLSVHHRNLSGYQDSLAIFESEDLYQRYIQGTNDAVKGVPDVFINGLAARIQGASTSENAEYRVDTALQSFLIENGFFTIEPTITLSNGVLRCNTTFARLGSSVAKDILLKMFVLQDMDTQWARRAVRGISRSNLIQNIQPGERKNIQFDAVSGLSNQPIRVIIAVVSEDEYTVYQVKEVRL